MLIITMVFTLSNLTNYLIKHSTMGTLTIPSKDKPVSNNLQYAINHKCNIFIIVNKNKLRL